MPAAAESGHSGAPDVIVASADGDRSTWFPTVERLANGDLIVVYYDATSHIGPNGSIALTRSTDDGRTWSPPTVVIDSELDDRDPSIVELADATLVLNWFMTDWSTSPLPTPGGVWTARSHDRGQTWSDPVRARSRTYGEGRWAIPPVGYGAPSLATSAKIVELPDGSLLLPAYGNTPDDADSSIALLRSIDGGRSWPSDLELPVAEHPAGNAFSEPAIARLADGTLVVAIRSKNVGYWTSSVDGGRSWEPAVATGRHHEQASDLLVVGAGHEQLILHTWGDTSGVFGPGRPTVGRMVSSDGVRHEPRVLYSGGAFDESYPSSVQIAPERFLTVYYDAARKIVGGTFSDLGDYRLG